ncbi:MAG: hypothetical protein AABX97_05295 [Candidatus Thermoplasmatota archaeon]
MFAPRTKAEKDSFELWKRLQPDDAYVGGIEECAGAFFVPTEANVTRALRQVDAIAKTTKDVTIRKFLASLKTRLTLPEPSHMPEAMVASFFGYMIKEGVVPDHMRALATAGRKALDAERKRHAGKRWPVGMRALVQLAASGLSQIVDIVEKELRDGQALAAVRGLRKAIDRYRNAFDLPGFQPDGTFPEIFAFFQENGCDLGRARNYARALRDLWDYRETPVQVEAAGLRMLRRELPRFKAVVGGLAKELGCEPTAEAVWAKMKETSGLKPQQILAFLNGVRDRAAAVADKHVVAINPHYTTLVVETPPYLASTTPSGAAYSVDSLTDHSKEVFLATTDERSNRRPTAGELLNLLVHEEYGHCVHGSNSYHAFAGTPSLVDILNSSFVCVSEGIAFQRELEFLPVLQEIAAGKLRGPEEEGFAEALRAWGGIEAIAKDYEFQTVAWRMTRFLRVIGDARINSGKQDLVKFIEWAHRATGLDRATIYYNVFPAHQILGPGYASTYAMIGERIREIQGRALRRGQRLREFNAYASSIGWPPKSVFEERLETWVKAD